MKTALALVLAFASTSAFAGTTSADYTACKATVANTFPDYKKVKIERMRSTDMSLRVDPSRTSESIRVKCDRRDHTLSLKDGTPLVRYRSKELRRTP